MHKESKNKDGVRGQKAYYECKYCGQLFDVLPPLGLHVRDFHKHERELEKMLSLQSKSGEQTLKIFLIKRLLNLHEQLNELKNSLSLREDRIKIIEHKYEELERLYFERKKLVELLEKCLDRLDNLQSFFTNLYWVLTEWKKVNYKY